MAFLHNGGARLSQGLLSGLQSLNDIDQPSVSSGLGQVDTGKNINYVESQDPSNDVKNLWSGGNWMDKGPPIVKQSPVGAGLSQGVLSALSGSANAPTNPLSVGFPEAFSNQSLNLPTASFSLPAKKTDIEKLTDQILAQGTSSRWSGEGHGSAEANAKAMAEILNSIGITDIKQFGKVDKYDPVEVTGHTLNGKNVFQQQGPEDNSGLRWVTRNDEPSEYEDGNPIYRNRELTDEEVKQLKPVYGLYQGQDQSNDDSKPIYKTLGDPEVIIKDGRPVTKNGYLFGNKETGQATPNTYGERQIENMWGGTYSGKGNTGYGVQFGADGTPYFYTQGASSNDLVNFLGDDPFLNALATVAATYFGGPAGAAALQAAKGADFKDMAKAAALAYVVPQGVSEISSAVGGLDSVVSALGQTGANTLGNMAGNVGMAALTGGDPVAALVSGGINAGTGAVLGQIPGFDQLSKGTQAAVTRVVSNTLQTGELSPELAIRAAIQAGRSTAASAMDVPTEAQYQDSANSFMAGLSGYKSEPDTSYDNIDIGGGWNPAAGYLPDNIDVGGGWSPADYSPLDTPSFKADYSLFPKSKTSNLPEMGGAQGVQYSAPESVFNDDNTINYSFYDTSTPMYEPSLTMPTAPNMDSMGGGQGLTVPVDGGKVTESGFMPDNYMPALGDPESFINQPAPNYTPSSTGSGAARAPSGGGAGAASQPAQQAATPTQQRQPFVFNYKDPDLDTTAQFLGSSSDSGGDGGRSGSELAALRQILDQITPELRSALQPSLSLPTLTLAGGGLAHGGLPSKYRQSMPKGHKPEFVTGLTGYYAGGRGTGQSDDIPAMLHDGDYVIDAEAVSAFGDGSSKAGKDVLTGLMKQVPHRDTAQGQPIPARIADGEFVLPATFVTALGKGDNKRGAQMLDTMRESLRTHKRSAPKSKIPPKALSPMDYMKKAK